MKYRLLVVLFALAIAVLPNVVLAAEPGKEMDKEAAFVDGLMSKMSWQEKLGQMNLVSVGFDVTGPIVTQDVDAKIKNGQVGGVFNTYSPNAVRKLQELAVNESRLKIPLLFGFDVIHGHRTIFPINLGLSCSWDPDLIERTARAAALEASADGINWVFSPMVDITRDPRWGRCSEGAGEDPYLGSCIAKAMVRGYQSKNYEKADSVLACVKHFALYGAAEAGRDYNIVDMSPVRMFNEYLPPYKAAVDAGVGSVMTSFNEINGVPATANKWLVTDLLRKQWGFNGLVATDYTAVSEMIAHGMGDEAKVTELAINAGIDLDMVSELFIKHGMKLIESGAISKDTVDAACRRMLEAKYKLGLFDDPYRFVDEKRNQTEMLSAEKLALSKEAAEKSFVLLKNDNRVLPLQPARKIAFIGPLVQDQRNLIGSWSGAGDWHKATSIWTALQTKYGSNKFAYAKGCNLIDDAKMVQRLNRDGADLTIDTRSPAEMIHEAVKTAQDSDIVVAVLGESFMMCGEAASRSQIGLPENQVELLKALKATGKPIVLVLMNGRPLTLPWENSNMSAILETWFAGTKAGDAIVDTLFGDSNPSGKLTMSFPVNVGQIPIYYAEKNTGRPFAPNEKYHSQYLDVPNAPLYSFGYGLSYTTFSMAEPKLSSNTITVHDTNGEQSRLTHAPDNVTVTTSVTNTGDRIGVETVQLYIRDLVGSITRPVKELKKFQKVELKPEETKEVSFTIKDLDLTFYDAHGRLEAEPGEFQIFVGNSSDSLKGAKLTFVLAAPQSSKSNSH
ncbi:MAG TPA: beta-glucosidase BglX [Planktothrix sp.]